MTKKQGKNTLIYLLVAIAVLVIIASLSGLLIENLYRDNIWGISQWKGQDLITIFSCIPLFLIGLFFSKKWPYKATILYLGALAYFLYTYASFSFSAVFNSFFLIYVAILSLCILTFIRIFTSDKVPIPKHWLGSKRLRDIIGMLNFIVFLFVGLAWLGMIVDSLFTGLIPETIISSGRSSSVVFVLDLAFVIPLAIYASFSFLKGKRIALLGIILVMGCAHGLALSSTSYMMFLYKIPHALDLLRLWVVVFVVCLVNLILFIKYLPIKQENNI